MNQAKGENLKLHAQRAAIVGTASGRKIMSSYFRRRGIRQGGRPLKPSHGKKVNLNIFDCEEHLCRKTLQGEGVETKAATSLEGSLVQRMGRKTGLGRGELMGCLCWTISRGSKAVQ